MISHIPKKGLVLFLFSFLFFILKLVFFMTENQDFIQVYTKGVKAWFPDKEEGWVSASCISNTVEGDKVSLKFIDDITEKVRI